MRRGRPASCSKDHSVSGSGFRVLGSGCRVEGVGLGFRV